MFFSLISYNIFSLCQKKKKTRTHVPFLFLFVVSKGSGKTQGVKKNHMMVVLIDMKRSESDSLFDVWDSQNGSGGCCKNKLSDCGAVTTGTWNSHNPQQFPSPQNMRCHQCSGKPPSSSCSW